MEDALLLQHQKVLVDFEQQISNYNKAILQSQQDAFLELCRKNDIPTEKLAEMQLIHNAQLENLKRELDEEFKTHHDRVRVLSIKL